MKFLHTSDLHIGLRLCEVSLNDVIEDALAGIAGIAEGERVDAVIVAGDLYDRSNPSPDAVAILDRFVTRLAAAGIRVLAVSGNHDSPERVAFLSSLLSPMGVCFSPVYAGTVEPVILCDAYGEVRFWLLPFFRPAEYRAAVPEFEGEGYHETLRAAIERLGIEAGGRNVLVAHQFVSDGQAGEEAGGIGAVGAELFAPFTYTALGHLHRAHAVGSEAVRYSGSPVKCSFAEAGDEKSVTLVELDAAGVEEIRAIPLTPLRDLRDLRGSFEELLSPEIRASGSTDDYLRVILTDEEDVVDALVRLRAVYPNLLRLAYDNTRTRALVSEEIETPDTDAPPSPEEVFARLYERQNNAPPDGETMEAVSRIFARLREGGAL